MEIISQHTKAIMEECKLRARDAGLSFDDESLEYIVTNQDMLELSPKGMIPTLYDFWVHDLQTIKGKKQYELYPHNPYETVINTRPAISYYNDNNPDWLNVMIFYHVLGHIDFFQNNGYFRHTWNDDFAGVALSDKRLINSLRAQHGRWVDYVIEFGRSLDNITGYYRELAELNIPNNNSLKRLDYFFDVFLQQVQKVSDPEYLKELDLYNRISRSNREQSESAFISEIKTRYPEFESNYEKYKESYQPKDKDVLSFLINHSPFLNKEENAWMKSILQIVRGTALYFEPQRRTKIINEGWASYWHNELFLADDRIRGHEADYARINAMVTSVPKVGLNPYAVGVRLFEHIRDYADRGRLSYEYEKTFAVEERRQFNAGTDKGLETLFDLRENGCDFNFINTFVDQDFVDRYKLVVIGQRVNMERMTREFYIKSKKAEDYKAMILEGLIHPPYIEVDESETTDDKLCLDHLYEGQQLVPEFIENVMTGIEYLWGGPVRLKTRLLYKDGPRSIVYYVRNRKLETHEAQG
jgi:stage V sporulation protein R